MFLDPGRQKTIKTLYKYSVLRLQEVHVKIPYKTSVFLHFLSVMGDMARNSANGENGISINIYVYFLAGILVRKFHQIDVPPSCCLPARLHLTRRCRTADLSPEHRNPGRLSIHHRP